MVRKGKEKGREKEKGSKMKGELPTIVEEDVSVVDNQILGSLEDIKQQIRRWEETIMSMLSANASQIQSITALLAEHGRAVEALAKKVKQLEACQTAIQKQDAPKIPVIDVDSTQPRSLCVLLREMAKEGGS
ncbi:hypothetical protein PIB30_037640 [Stylosanthes scabra]|uniref:Uncharacterized protein n=1 Tax=Stylosanthes scabra TaxID=79078 RepID=A0ABU6REA9_9FABA|nr:hypothetical protein [Stylosanthes scabra]